MKLSVMSYSFHRSFACGEMTLESYIDWCEAQDVDQIDPWDEHLKPLLKDSVRLNDIATAISEVGMTVGCVAVDAAPAYALSREAFAPQLEKITVWLDLAQALGAAQVRVNAGGPENAGEETIHLIASHFTEIIEQAQRRNLEVLVENHGGATKQPDSLIAILDATPGLGLLFDSGNWPANLKADAWHHCGPRARSVHISMTDLSGSQFRKEMDALKRLMTSAAYQGPWVVETESHTLSERDAVTKVLNYLKGESRLDL